MISSIDYKENERLAGEALDAYTKNKLNKKFNFKHEHISLVFKDKDGVIIGRLVGSIFFNCLNIEMLIVDQQHNRNGIGKALLIAAEKKGKELGCTFSHLETMSFNAPGFYEKNGYTLTYKAENSPIKNESHHFYIKELI